VVVAIVLVGSTTVSAEVRSARSTFASIAVSITCLGAEHGGRARFGGGDLGHVDVLHRRGVDDDVDLGHRGAQARRVTDLTREEPANPTDSVPLTEHQHTPLHAPEHKWYRNQVTPDTHSVRHHVPHLSAPGASTAADLQPSPPTVTFRSKSPGAVPHPSQFGCDYRIHHPYLCIRVCNRTGAPSSKASPPDHPRTVTGRTRRSLPIREI
jgi:hypothetical protein